MQTGSQAEINYTFAELQCLLGVELRRSVVYHFYRQGEVFIEELLQQTWIKIWLKVDQCRGLTRLSILAWIKQTSFHIGMNMVRDSQRLEELIHLGEGSSRDDSNSLCEENVRVAHENLVAATRRRRPTEDQVVFSDLMQKWCERLTSQELKVFLLSMDGCSKSEIAEIMNISRPRVTQYIDQIAAKNVGVDW